MPSNPSTVTIDTLMQRALEVPGLLSLAAGFTDNSALPRSEVQRIVTDLLASPETIEVLQYGSARGRPELRDRLAARIAEADAERNSLPKVDAADVIVANGSQQALFLATSALCKPGDVVLVDSPTYFVFLDVLAVLGIEAVPLPSSGDLLDADALPEYFERLRGDGILERVRAVYVVSYFSNPTGLSLDADRKQRLLAEMKAQRIHVPVLEDIAYRDLYFDEPWPAPSLLAKHDDDIPIAVFGTFTKTFSTGIKVGYAYVPHEPLRRTMLSQKRAQDFGTANFNQAIVERALVSGVCDSYLQTLRKIYARKCDRLDAALDREGLRRLGWRWTRPPGGLYLWLTSPDDLDTTGGSRLFERCLEERVLYVPGDLCFGGDARRDKVRLSFGYLPEDDLDEAAARFVRAAERCAP